MKKRNLLVGYFFVLAVLLIPAFSVEAKELTDSFPFTDDHFELVTSQIGGDFHSFDLWGVSGVLADMVETEAVMFLRSPQLENKYQEFAPKEFLEKEGTLSLGNQKEQLVLSDLREKQYQPVWEVMDKFLTALKTKI